MPIKARGSSLLWVLLMVALLGAGTFAWQQGWLSLPGLSGSPDSADEVSRRLDELREVLAPSPLRGPLDQAGEALSIAGVLQETNEHRAAAGLPALRSNSTLNEAAKNKLNDMFAQQYFDHESPDGRGPGDVVDAVGYEYVRVGENLALGNFAGDADLVQAWMDSPGHRENILHTGFSELGVAVGQGTFQGQRTWLAVQTFALPLSSCPEVDGQLQREFEQHRATYASLNEELTTRQQELERELAALNALRAEIDRLIQEGNAEIEEGNRIYRETGDRDAAQPYWDRGEELHAQAREKEAAYEPRAAAFEEQREQYNARVREQQALGDELETLVDRLNVQIQAFNACLKQ